MIDEHIEVNNLGELFQDVDTILDYFNVRRPDILYFSAARKKFIGKRAMEGPPDLAVEVLSPSSRQIDRVDKFSQYAKGGIKYYWIVDPEEREIEAWRLKGGHYVACGRGENAQIVSFPPFPDLAIPLTRLWRK